MLRVFLCLALILGCQGFHHYHQEIPNGDYVPNPCKDNSLWSGVGHKDPEGGGPRNPFGLDFLNCGRKWTDELCRKDSDGDGKTNGEELGDPDCVWTTGTSPPRMWDISHPGICDPWDSEKCAAINSWLPCDANIFKCNATSDPDVKNFTLRFPPTNVPAQRINYYCMAFRLEDYLDMSQKYHLVASQPKINNSIVLREIRLFGCADEAQLSPTAKPCSVVKRGCEDLLAVWTPGVPGTCEHEAAGYKIEKSRHKKMVMQILWTNSELRTDYVDSSGLTLYYTPKLRNNDIGTMMIGQMYLNIPPGSKRSVFESSCSEGCTEQFFAGTGNIFLTSGFSEMRNLGYTQTVDHVREGETIRGLIRDTNYSYGSPKLHVYTSLISFLPGDELKTTCVYRSESKNRTTLYGEGENDEQCSSVFFYFPKQNMRPINCAQWKSLDECKIMMGTPINGCSAAPYMNQSTDQFRTIYKEVMNSCNHWGPCRPECRAVVNRTKKNPCFQGEMAEFLLANLVDKNDAKLMKFAQAFVSCDHDVTPCIQLPSSSASLPVSSLFVMLFLFFLSL